MEIKKEIVKKATRQNAGVREVHPGVFQGPWLETYFDNYTECLMANRDYLRNKELREAGLNEQGQTKEQEKEFKKRLEEAKRKKEQAEVAKRMVAQTK